VLCSMFAWSHWCFPLKFLLPGRPATASSDLLHVVGAVEFHCALATPTAIVLMMLRHGCRPWRRFESCRTRGARRTTCWGVP